MTSKKLSYYEKLKDPRWQKKRLEVMQANDFHCERCFDSESTLNVHHKEYFKGREPWEYDLNQLSVLCETCHEEHHKSDDFLKYISSILDIDGPMCRDSIAIMLSGYIGLDYELSLNKSGFEDCAYFKAFYERGVKFASTDINMRAYIEMYRKKYG